LQEVAPCLPKESITRDPTAKEIIQGKVSKEALEALFEHVDEKKASILHKQEKLKQTLKGSPSFTAGWFQLAVTYMQLHRTKEAIYALNKCHALNPQDITTEYYLAALYIEKYNYKKAWEHMAQAESLEQSRNYASRSLKTLKRQLTLLAPKQLQR